ncbi:MAG: hypothetical protein HY048_01135 [Acidobacteria bacterium]|nr:hypothetical protein [Acidobacteriota bacterium]
MRRPNLWILIVATLVTGACWGLAVPPFESADESSFYNAIVRYTHGENPGGWLLYAAAVKPAMVLAGGPDRPVPARYNPSFRFVSNLRGRVNVYMHGRAEGIPRGDVNRLYLLRLCTLLMWTVSLVLIFETARLFTSRDDLALLTAGACLFLPEASFFASKIHPEATTVLLASAAYCAFTARVCGRIGRTAVWIAGLVIVMAAPFSDRQAYFLVLLVPFGFVVTEPTKRGAAIAAAALAGTAALAFVIVPRPVEMQRDLTMWLAPMFSFFTLTWWNPYLWLHLKYELGPKMFLGFWGWLGQPSILLPAPVYAAFAVMSKLAAIGLVVRDRSAAADTTARERTRLAWFYAGGVFLTFAPILYTNMMIERIVVGRWMLPSLAPIMIALVVGLHAFIVEARRRPHRLAAIVAILGGVLALQWVSPIGAAIRDGIRHYHYGDQEHLIRIITGSIVGVLIAAACVEIAPRVRFAALSVRQVFAGLMALNLTLLFAFVAPLYRPFDEAGYAEAVRAEAAAGEFDRAASLLRIAQRSYPESVPLARIPSELPLISLRGDSDQLLADFEARIGRGQALENRDELMALARAVRKAGRFEPDVLRAALARAKETPALREPLALIRAEVEGRQRDGSAAATVIRAGDGTIRQAEMHGVAMLEGFTTYRHPDDGTIEIRIYFRPLRDWTNVMRLQLGAVPAGSPGGPAEIDPLTPLFGGWRAGELAWETFALSGSTAWQLWTGVEFEHDNRGAIDLGVINRRP